MLHVVDEQYNSCSAPEEDSSTLSDSQEFVYTSYAPGTLVWAKVTGYPWYSVCMCRLNLNVCVGGLQWYRKIVTKTHFLRSTLVVTHQ